MTFKKYLPEKIKEWIEDYKGLILSFFILTIMLAYAVYITFKKTYEEIEEIQTLKKEYIEKEGGGLIVGKTMKGETVIKVKDSLLFIEDKKLYYLSEKNDSVQSANGTFIIQHK